MLEDAQSNCKSTGDSFQTCWKPLGNKFKKLRQYCGGVASVMPGTSSVESDFSIINWTKDSHSKCLTDFSLESILQLHFTIISKRLIPSSSSNQSIQCLNCTIQKNRRSSPHSIRFRSSGPRKFLNALLTNLHFGTPILAHRK